MAIVKKKKKQESGSESESEGSNSREEGSSGEERKGKGKRTINNNGRGRRVEEDRYDNDKDNNEDKDSDDDEDEDDDEDSQNMHKTSRKQNGRMQGSLKSGNGSGIGGGGGPMQPLVPLQQQKQKQQHSITGNLHRSPVRTVSLNDTHPARRRLSGKGFEAGAGARARASSAMGIIADLRRQSLPSSLRKASLADSDASFTSSHAGGPNSPGYPALSNKHIHPSLLRRTSNGLALNGGGSGGIGALHAADALRRNGSNNSTTLADASLPIPVLSMEAMNTNYEEWMKMATDNKINSSNTWSFALIDYFHDMSLLRNTDDPGSINFQKASITLDGCVKIWTSRVDSVASETGKLLNGLSGDTAAAAAKEDDEDADDDNIAGDGENEGEGRPKKKRARNPNATTLADSFSKIQVKDLELEFTVDPLFKKTSADFDEGGAAGLLMNHLGSDSTMRVVFDAGDAKVEDSDEEEETHKNNNEPQERLNVDIARLKAKFLPDLDALANMTICPSLSAFKFSADPSLLDMSLFNRTHLEASTSSSATSSLHQPVNLLDDLTVYENAGHGAGTQDFFDDVGNNFDNDCMGGGDGGDDYDMGLGSGGGGHEGYGDGGDDDLSDNGIESSMQGSGGQHLGAVQRFDPRLTEDQREVVIGMGGEDGDRKVFSYFDSALSKNWAGPEHWKMRRTARKVMQENDQESPAADDGTNKSSKSKRTPKEPFHINFSVDVEAPSSKTIFATSNASITMPVSKRKAGRLQEKKEDFLLPDDMHFSSQQLLRLFLKPKAAVNMRKRLHRAAPRPEGEVDEHYWAAAAAAQAIGADGGADDEDDDEGPPLPFDTQFFHDEVDTPDFDEDLPIGGDEFEGGMDMDMNNLPEDNPGSDANNLDGKQHNNNSNNVEEEEDLLATTQGQMRRARPQFINYAKKAKRVDVKKLKENIWKELGLDDLPIITRSEGENGDAVQPQPKQFTSVISGLRKTYPQEKMEEISTSFCFICLLHLANEQGLRIQSENPENQVDQVQGQASSSNIKIDDMESTATSVGGLDKLKIGRQVVA